MKLNFKTYLKTNVIIVLIFLLLSFILQIFAKEYFVWANYFTSTFFAITAILTSYFINKKVENNSKITIGNLFMVASFIKMFILVGYILIYLFAIKKKILPFTTFAILNYIAFTFFEVKYLLTSTKK
jgi:hypothetical protein